MKPNSNAVCESRSTTHPSRALLVVASLLMPGGALLLGWMLCRRLLPRLSGQGIKRIVQTPLLPLLLIVLLQGCATQIGTRLETSGDGKTAVAVPVLQMQNPSAAPEGENALLGPEALRPGDILLTSMPGVAAAGIELMTVAPVSHAALYIGDGRVVEAVRSGVRERGIGALIAEESIALVLRDPDLNGTQVRSIREYARHKLGAGFNFFGITVQVPYSISRKVCELPLVAAPLRDACIRSMGVLSQLAPTEEQLFCSQLVLQAYRHAGVPLTDADPRIISPADILHMREGDVPSVAIRKPLHYVGHLKYARPVLAGLAR
jgi:uncharacterized protein YycO